MGRELGVNLEFQDKVRMYYVKEHNHVLRIWVNQNKLILLQTEWEIEQEFVRQIVVRMIQNIFNFCVWQVDTILCSFELLHFVDSVKASRFFHIQSSRRFNQDFIAEFNKFSSRESKEFQGEYIKLECFGHCGSEISKFWVKNTNLEIYESSQQPERFVDIRLGRASNEYYKTLSFNSQENEDKFCKLLIARFENEAKNSCRHTSMVNKVLPTNRSK